MEVRILSSARLAGPRAGRPAPRSRRGVPPGPSWVPWATSSPHPTSSEGPPPPPRWRRRRRARPGPPAGPPTRCRWPTAARACSRRCTGQSATPRSPGRSGARSTRGGACWRTRPRRRPDRRCIEWPRRPAGRCSLRPRGRPGAGHDRRGGPADPRRGRGRGTPLVVAARRLGHHRRGLGGRRGHRHRRRPRAGRAPGGLRRDHPVRRRRPRSSAPRRAPPPPRWSP